jgi:hypothetical protein
MSSDTRQFAPLGNLGSVDFDNPEAGYCPDQAHYRTRPRKPVGTCFSRQIVGKCCEEPRTYY